MIFGLGMLKIGMKIIADFAIHKMKFVAIMGR